VKASAFRRAQFSFIRT